MIELSYKYNSMGNVEGSEKKSEEDLQAYLQNLMLYRKEHSYNLGKDVTLYKPSYSASDEELVLLVVLDFEEEANHNKSPDEFLKNFKRELNLRKNFDSLNLSKLLFVNYKKIQALCTEKLQCRLSFDYSDYDLYKFINESRVMRSSMMSSFNLSPQQCIHFLACICNALICLKRNGKTHGFIMPSNVLLLNRNSTKPIYKLQDVALISGYPQ